MAARRVVSIDIVSDAICPWCYVGSRRLAAALRLLPDVAAAVRWRPFFLDRTLPAGGVDKLEHYYKKFGRARVDAMVPQMQRTGDALDPPVKFDYGGQIHPTSFAHAAAEAAWAEGGALLQGAVVEALFSHYFERRGGLDAASVARVAAAAGLSAAGVAAAGAPAAAAVAAAEADARRDEFAIDGVPFFVIRGARAGAAPVTLAGAQEPRAIAAAIARAADA